MDKEELDLEEFDQTIYKLIEKAKKEGAPVEAADEERIKEFEAAYLSLKLATNGEVVTKLSPDESYGAISIRGRNILIRMPDVLLKAFETATNFEIISDLAGMTELNFMYYGLKKVVAN